MRLKVRHWQKHQKSVSGSGEKKTEAKPKNRVLQWLRYGTFHFSTLGVALLSSACGAWVSAGAILLGEDVFEAHVGSAAFYALEWCTLALKAALQCPLELLVFAGILQHGEWKSLLMARRPVLPASALLLSAEAQKAPTKRGDFCCIGAFWPTLWFSTQKLVYDAYVNDGYGYDVVGLSYKNRF